MAPDLAKSAWDRAVEKAVGQKVTAGFVQAALREVQHTTPPAEPKPIEKRPSRLAKRKLIDSAFGELLVLLQQKAAHVVLLEKVKALYQHIRAALPKPRRSGKS